jgi:ribosomal protein S18 acetylase RimI-like enzyme
MRPCGGGNGGPTDAPARAPADHGLMDLCCTTPGDPGPQPCDPAGTALAEDTPAAWRDLARRADEAVVERDADFEPEGWTLLHRTAVLWMVSTRRARPEAPPAPVLDLAADDLPAFRELLALGGPGAVVLGALVPVSVGTRSVEPGPVVPERAALPEREDERVSHLVGIRAGGILVAAAGLRLPEPRHAEIAFVVTHPDHASGGHAGGLVDALVERARSSGRASWLRIRPDDAAVEDWRRRGFAAVGTAAVEHRIRAT